MKQDHYFLQVSQTKRGQGNTLLGPGKRGNVKEAFSWPFEQQYGNNGHHTDTKDIHWQPLGRIEEKKMAARLTGNDLMENRGFGKK